MGCQEQNFLSKDDIVNFYLSGLHAPILNTCIRTSGLHAPFFHESRPPSRFYHCSLSQGCADMLTCHYHGRYLVDDTKGHFFYSHFSAVLPLPVPIQQHPGGRLFNGFLEHVTWNPLDIPGMTGVTTVSVFVLLFPDDHPSDLEALSAFYEAIFGHPEDDVASCDGDSDGIQTTSSHWSL